MQDNEVQGFLELSMQADNFLKTLSINRYLPLPLYLISECKSGAQLIDILIEQGMVIVPNWLYAVPFEASFEEIMHQIMTQDKVSLNTHWLDYILDTFINNKDHLDYKFKIQSHEICINSLLALYTIGLPNSTNLDETPLIVIFTALRAIIAKRLIKENIVAIRYGLLPPHEIELYF